MTVANQIIIEANDGEEKTLKLLLNNYIAATLLQKGCQKFELYQLFDEREHFFIIEIWKSERRHKAFYEGDVCKNHQQAMQTCIKTEASKPLKLTQCLTELGLKAKEEKK